MSTTLIINRPEVVPQHRRLIYGAVTLAIWYLWLYLWLPLLTLAGWFTGGALGYEHMVVLEGYRSLVSLLGWYALTIAIMGGALVIWATYNLLRFRGKERRTPLPDAGVAAYAQHFGVTAAELTIWRKAKMLTILHSASGGVERVAVAS